MRPFRFAVFSLVVVSIILSVAQGQSLSSTVSASANGAGVCGATVEGSKILRCKGSFSDPMVPYSGTYTVAAEATYSRVAIAGEGTLTVVDTGSSVAVEAEAVSNDVFTLGNYPYGSAIYVASILTAMPTGTLSGEIILQITLSTEGPGIGGTQCSLQNYGTSSCWTLTPLPAGTSSNAYLNVLLGASSSVVCQDTCSGASGFEGGFENPGGGGKILVIKVVDSNGNPVKGATITSASGHKYPTNFASTTTLTASPNPSELGDLVTFTVVVASFGRSSTPTGKVTFKDSTTGTTLGHVALSSGGTATFTTSDLTLGTHTITATYGGDDWSGSSHATLSEVVN